MNPLFAGNWRRSMAVVLAAGILTAAINTASAAEAVYVGVPLFGPGPWEIDTIRRHKLDELAGLQIEVVDLGGKLVSPVALDTEAADFVMTDHLFVSEQRWQGQEYTFVPHTKLGGNLIARPDRGINSIEDFAGKTVVIANGISAQSWLLLRAYTIDRLGWDIAETLDSVNRVSTPTLLRDPINTGAVDAVVNTWQNSVRLRQQANKQILAIDDILADLGLADHPPILGWVFRESFAAEYPDIAMGFLRVSLAARSILLNSDEEWEMMRLSLPVHSESEFLALRDAYRAAIITSYGSEQRVAAERLFDLLRRMGGPEAVDGTQTLAPGTFFVMGGPRPGACARMCTWDGRTCEC